MAEGVMVAGTKQVVGDAVMNDKARKPDPDPVKAPNGWAWDRSTGNWRPAKKRGNYARAKVSDSPPVSEPGPSETPSDSRQRDPDPGWFSEPEPKGGKRKQTIADVPQPVLNDLQGALGFVGVAVLPVVEAIDPYCGRALTDNYQRIAEACLPLICKSERVVKFMTSGGGGLMDYAALALALAPVGKAVLEHHVRKSVEVVRDEHGVHFVARQRGGEMGDHLTPPMPDYREYVA